MPGFCACLTNVKWRKTKKVFGMSPAEPNEMLKKSNIIQDFETIGYDDCFDCEYNGVKFSIEEGIACSGGKNRKSYVVFHGLIITIQMNKNFNGNTVIRQDSMLHKAPASNLHHTILEDVEFEKVFDVYTDDDIEARYLITPSLIERMRSIQDVFNAKIFAASFYQNKFIIALKTNKDWFSLGKLNKNVCDKEPFFKMFDEIISTMELIDHFKLNQNIGL